MCSAELASPHPNLGATASAQGPLGPFPTRGRGKSSFCPHIIGQVRLWVYYGAVTPCQRHRPGVIQSSALAMPLMIH
jgi:hypothetical protein